MYTHYAIMFILNRGKDFRQKFHEIGSIRSLIPKSVKIMALTATATQDTLDCVVEHLSLENHVIIGLPPNRPNIKYIIEKGIDIRTFCHQFVKELLIMRTNMPKTVIFCRSLLNCATFFATIKKLMGKNITDPPGAQYNGHLECCLVENFTAVSSQYMREAVLKEFCKCDTKLRVLVATNAFGMDIDCPDIERIINWGCPNTLEELVQETGRGGRDGHYVQAILYSTAIVTEFDKTRLRHTKLR